MWVVEGVIDGFTYDDRVQERHFAAYEESIVNDMNKLETHSVERLLREYFAGNIDGESLLKIREWIFSGAWSEEKERILKKIFGEYISRYRGPSRSAVRAWEKRCVELGITDTTRTLQPFRPRLLRITAVVFPLLVLTAALVMLVHRNIDMSGYEPLAEVTVVRADEQKEHLLLPCGSQVWLNSGSEIRYDEAQFAKSRSVDLSGDAYFSVSANENRPFTVHAGELTVTVLGTEFDVKTDDSADRAEVLLYEGRVEVAVATEVRRLSPNERFTFDRTDSSIVVEEFHPDRLAAWRLSFDLPNVSLEAALRDVATRFALGLDIQGDIPRERMLRARFVDEDVNDVLLIIHSITGGFAYRIENNILTVKPAVDTD